MDSFYKIIKQSIVNNSAEYIIELNEKHEIYNGHFPSQPVTPGACQVQILKELLEQTTNKKLLMNNVKDIKFSSMIDPSKNNSLKVLADIDESNENFKVKATFYNGDIVSLKFRGEFSFA